MTCAHPHGRRHDPALPPTLHRYRAFTAVVALAYGTLVHVSPVEHTPVTGSTRRRKCGLPRSLHTRARAAGDSGNACQSIYPHGGC